MKRIKNGKDAGEYINIDGKFLKTKEFKTINLNVKLEDDTLVKFDKNTGNWIKVNDPEKKDN